VCAALVVLEFVRVDGGQFGRRVDVPWHGNGDVSFIGSDCPGQQPAIALDGQLGADAPEPVDPGLTRRS